MVNIELVDDNPVRYDGKTLLINCKPELKPLFTNGMRYPEIFNSQDIKIGGIEEISFLNNSVQVKRFKFFLSTSYLANPVIYFFELTNKKASAATTLADFIMGCKLTFVKQGWVQV